MRIVFPSIMQAKRNAKSISAEVKRPLMLSQQALAKACGYKDWHELEVSLAKEQSHEPTACSNEELARIIINLSKFLSVSSGDILYALTKSKFSNEMEKIDNQLIIRSLCFRSQEIPYIGKNKIGDVGKIDEGEQLAIVKKHSGNRGVRCFINKTPNALRADFEYNSLGKKGVLFIPRRFFLPYGQWDRNDGTKILFSRDYLPMWQIFPDGKPPIRCNPTDSYGWERQSYFWGDYSWPWVDDFVYKQDCARLKDFGVLGLPKTVEWMPFILTTPNILNINDAYAHFNNENKDRIFMDNN